MLQIAFGTRRHHPELERLICTAVSNKQLAALLLANPEVALMQFEQRYSQLTPAERSIVTSITGATDIHEFAARLHAKVQQRMEAPGPRV